MGRSPSTSEVEHPAGLARVSPARVLHFGGVMKKKPELWNPLAVPGHMRNDVLVRNENTKRGRTLCEKCQGTGNQLYSMYQACEDCNGTGCLL